MNPADLWELLTKHGIAPDSATAIVQTHAGMGDADLWERLTQNGASPDAATSIVKARGTPDVSAARGASGTFGNEPAPDTRVTGTNLGRSFMQGATFNFGDKGMGLDPAAQKAFQSAHPIANALGEIAGGAVAPIAAATAFPALATGAGALGLMGTVGALSGAGAADPNAPDATIMTPMGTYSVPSRIIGAGIGGTLSTLLGKAGQKVAEAAGPTISAVLRSRAAPTVGAQEVAMDATRKAAGKAAYGAARTEADAAASTIAGPGTPLAGTLRDPVIAPFAELASSLPKNAGASEGRIAMETYKLMSREQTGLLQRMADNGFDAALDAKNQILSAAKGRLKADASQVMPSFPGAVVQNARMKGEEQAMQRGADIAQSVFSGRHIAGKKLIAKSAEAFARDAQSWTPEQLQAAAQGILGRLKENPQLARVPFTKVPIPFPSAAVRSTPSILDMVGQASNAAVPSAKRTGLLTAAIPGMRGLLTQQDRQ